MGETGGTGWSEAAIARATDSCSEALSAGRTSEDMTVVSWPIVLTSFHLLEGAKDLGAASIESSDEVVHQEEGARGAGGTLDHVDE